ncbi:hypothetical protein M9435_005655 [Picochlorum sp. BPE23]|nr:hypothetical protein M9435_005655 [Picochlorum sp. BPE23]
MRALLGVLPVKITFDGRHRHGGLAARCGSEWRHVSDSCVLVPINKTSLFDIDTWSRILLGVDVALVLALRL